MCAPLKCMWAPLKCMCASYPGLESHPVCFPTTGSVFPESAPHLPGPWPGYTIQYHTIQYNNWFNYCSSKEVKLAASTFFWGRTACKLQIKKHIVSNEWIRWHFNLQTPLCTSLDKNGFRKRRRTFLRWTKWTKLLGKAPHIRSHKLLFIIN